MRDIGRSILFFRKFIFFIPEAILLIKKSMKKLTFIAGLILSTVAHTDIVKETAAKGDYYLYTPSQEPHDILVIAHGMLSTNEVAADVALKYLYRWIKYAEEHRLLIIAPIFDTSRFGNLGGGYGGYRNLFGKFVSADQFINDVVDHYSETTNSKQRRFYLYGHSAGGQFVNRYVVTHPDRIIKAVVSAAGRYTYPTHSIPWPYGAGNFNRNVKWEDGSTTSHSITKSLIRYARAASKTSIVIGSKDTKPQPARPAHKGKTRIALAKSWAKEMNRNAKKHGLAGNVKVYIIDGIGHSSSALTPFCAEVLFQ